MRKLNQIRRAIIFASIGLMFGFGAGGSSNNVAASEAGTQPPQALIRTGVVHDYGLSIGQVVAGVTQTVSLRNDAEAVGLSDNESSQTNSLRYGIKLSPIQQPKSSPRKIEGDWEGTLDAGVAKLRLVVHIVRKNGVLSATLDSPDQGATDQPIDSVTLSSASVRFEMKSSGGLYEGQLAKDDSQIEGNWMQTFRLQATEVGDW